MFYKNFHKILITYHEKFILLQAVINLKIFIKKWRTKFQTVVLHVVLV